MSGVDIATVSRLLGHKSLAMTLRYSHFAPDHMAKAVQVLGMVLDDKSGGSVGERLKTMNYIETI
jgi:hypothetical protein